MSLGRLSGLWCKRGDRVSQTVAAPDRQELTEITSENNRADRWSSSSAAPCVGSPRHGPRVRLLRSHGSAEPCGRHHGAPSAPGRGPNRLRGVRRRTRTATLLIASQGGSHSDQCSPLQPSPFLPRGGDDDGRLGGGRTPRPLKQPRPGAHASQTAQLRLLLTKRKASVRDVPALPRALPRTSAR